MSQAKIKRPASEGIFGDRAPLQLDLPLTAAIAALAALGIVMISSASIAIADKQEVGSFYYVIKHLIALSLGGTIAWLALRMPLDNLEKASPLFMLLVFPLLMLVFVPGLGVTVNGATRWVRTGLLNFQVIEAVKIMLIIYLAGYLVRQHDALAESFKGSLKPCLLVGLVALLLLLQPDFGSAVLVTAVTAAMIWIGGARFRDLLVMGLVALPALAWLATSESYRMRRLVSFLDPWADPYAGGFQLTQALIAIGRGEWIGVGLGGSVQKLFYLPEAHTDFILAVLAEELGLMGVTLVLALFALLVGRGLLIAARAMHLGLSFAGYLAYGLSVLIGLQAAISVGVNFGVLPTKGLTLPLISSGGSSTMMICVMLGLLLRVGHEVNVAEAAERERQAKQAKRKAKRKTKTEKSVRDPLGATA